MPDPPASDDLTPRQLAFIAERLPEPPLSPTGRPAYSNCDFLPGILPDAAKTAEPTLLADKGYDSLRFRQVVHDRGFRPLILTRACIPTQQAVDELYADDTSLHRKRNVIESTLGWLKAFRRLWYRGDRAAVSLHAFV